MEGQQDGGDAPAHHHKVHFDAGEEGDPAGGDHHAVRVVAAGDGRAVVHVGLLQVPSQTKNRFSAEEKKPGIFLGRNSFPI